MGRQLKINTVAHKFAKALDRAKSETDISVDFESVVF